MIPLRSASFSQNKNILGLANSFSGGIFLAVALGQMIPHSLSILTSIDKPNSIALYGTLAGFLIMFSVEKVLFSTDIKSSEHDSDQNSSNGGDNLNLDTLQSDKSNAFSEYSKFNSPTSTYSSSISTSPYASSYNAISSSIHSTDGNSNGNSVSKKSSAILLLLAMSIHR